MFDRVLIANRGEIACRVIQTCRRLGIEAVAVYSAADREARHVRLADEAVAIGPPSAAESYLAMDRVLAAAAATGAEAIHPGYGFLAESAEFARRCVDAGLGFIGPRPETIELMGSKRAAKRHMEAAGVPTVPGYHGDDQSLETLAREAQRMGFPVLVKASAGGGGKGMRIARTARDLEGAVTAARREARSAFGDDQLLLERFLERPRHIELQIFGDSQGHVLHLHERECSIQRRYQKIIEETPSPFLDEATRAAMARAAVTAARAVSYVNAGTVEFIVDSDRSFYFMEMNTRLQVEHPVTEMITGLDLVEWQLRVAAGEPLPLEQERIAARGHAIEARVYAERPGEDFLPSTGRVAAFLQPSGERNVRLDTGVEDGDTISIHYDPMIAKLIAWGEDRATAIATLRRALAETTVFGLETNLALLRRIAAHERFGAGAIDTGYIDRHLDELTAPETDVPAPVYLAAAAREMLGREARVNGNPRRTPWEQADGWQANGRTRNRLVFASAGGARKEVDVAGWQGCYAAEVDGRTHAVTAAPHGSRTLVMTIDGAPQRLRVDRHGTRYLVSVGMDAYELAEEPPYPVPQASDAEELHPGSPMPGRIVSIEVQAGDEVTKGQGLVVLEGMKMEYTVRARRDGIVERVLYAVGDLVEAEVPLVDIGAGETT